MKFNCLKWMISEEDIRKIDLCIFSPKDQFSSETFSLLFIGKNRIGDTQGKELIHPPLDTPSLTSNTVTAND